ncbi:MAG: hypothetical protein NT023_09670 [Armatimonadetes bacterium]|nr:hypothetical protein [Armatimonadota bacterium]
MQEFLEPTEERVTLPTVQTDEAQEAANCDALIAEIEDVGRSEALVTMGSICVLFSVTIALSLLLYAIPNGGLSLYIITHWKVALGEWYHPVLRFIGTFPAVLGAVCYLQTKRNRRLRKKLDEVLSKISKNPNPLLITSLLKLAVGVSPQHLEIPGRLTPIVNGLMMNMDAHHVAHFQKGDIYLLNMGLGWNKANHNLFTKMGFPTISPFAVVNVLKYVGNEASIRALRQILSKPPPVHDAYQVLFHQTIEAAIPAIEARIAREDTHQNLLRPSQEREEPAEELLRPVEEER